MEEIAKGLLHLVNLSNLTAKIKVGSRQHVQVQQLLIDMNDLAVYQRLVVDLLFTSNTISADSWTSFAQRFWALASVLAGVDEQPEAAQSYLAWAAVACNVCGDDPPNAPAVPGHKQKDAWRGGGNRGQLRKAPPAGLGHSVCVNVTRSAS